jgi:hypothetical protein
VKSYAHVQYISTYKSSTYQFFAPVFARKNWDKEIKKSIMNVQFNFEGLENNIPTHFTFHLTRFFKKTCSKEKR